MPTAKATDNTDVNFESRKQKGGKISTGRCIKQSQLGRD